MTEKTYKGSCHCGAVRFEDFCKTCGIRVFGGTDEAKPGSPSVFVNVAALNDVDRDELVAAPMKYVDGRHDRFDKPPADTRLL
jgi:hypothetical protein